jgi:hypothetical protein
MSEERYNQNQTQFAVEEPLMELPVEPPAAPQPETPAKKTLPKWLLPVAAGVLVLFLIILAIAARNRTQGPMENEPKPPATAAPVLSPMEQRLEATKALLRDANPTIQDLPFPPLDMKLKIDGR